MEHAKMRESQLALNQRLRQWARKLKNEVTAMYFVLQHPETPLYAKVLAAIIVGYALSPIDFIPDFIPLLGYVDNVILLPLGIALVIKLIPAAILDICRERAKTNPPVSKPTMWISAYIIVVVWLIALYLLYSWLK